MYELSPPAVYVHESVADNETYRGRAEGVVNALAEPVEPIVFSDEDLPDLVNKHGLIENRKPMGTLAEVRDPILMFNTFRFDGRGDEEVARFKALGIESEDLIRELLGYRAFHWSCYNQEGDPHRHDKVCRPCWRVHLQHGCAHRCDYCPLGGLLVSMVNIEEYCEHFGRLVERHPWQKTYLLDDDGDPLCLEPEHGCLGPLIEWFGTLDERYLIIHTKSWNTGWMEDLRHNGNTIIVWSVTGPKQSALIEPKTGTTEQRIEAARVAAEAGYQIRYKFKPIIPVVGWREEAAETVKMMFDRTKPDIISLCVYMWQDVETMVERLGTELLDPECLRAAYDERASVENTRTSPFPPRIRAMIYEHYLGEIRKHDRDIPVSLSTENFAMWKAFEDRLGMTATNYVCGCGPQSVPGAKKLTDHAFKVAVRHPDEVPASVLGLEAPTLSPAQEEES
ncbi:MAG: hypothetical protein JXQ73_14950 [Phycisphaerae bacterium]|nr:hypothetical protein [Phycisphaerae bacterium]